MVAHRCGTRMVIPMRKVSWWNETVNKQRWCKLPVQRCRWQRQACLQPEPRLFRNNSQYDVGYWDKINTRLNTEYTFNRIVKLGFNLAPVAVVGQYTQPLLGCNVYGHYAHHRRRGVGENIYNNYARSTTTRSERASLARANAHSRLYGVLLNPIWRSVPLKDSAPALSMVSTHSSVAATPSHLSSSSMHSRSRTSVLPPAP